MARSNITSDKAPAAIGPYSQAVWCGDLLYLSGQTPIDPATGILVEGGIEAQTGRAFDNLEEVLKAAGLRMEGAPEARRCMGCGKIARELGTYDFFPDTIALRSAVYSHQGLAGAPSMNLTAAMKTSMTQGSWRLPVRLQRLS